MVTVIKFADPWGSILTANLAAAFIRDPGGGRTILR
jgi:hypothetical protein